MFRIGKFSSLAKISVKTLRFYDEIGLFKPSFVDENGYRYYSIEQLSDLQKIVYLRSIDISTLNIKKVFKNNNISDMLKNKINELELTIRNSEEKIILIKKSLLEVEKGEFMNNYKAKEIIIPKCTVYYRHGVIDSMENLFDFVLEAGAEAKKNNPTLQCEDYCFITYSEKGYKEKDVELEYVEAVKNKGKESENIKFKELKEQKAISVLHKGDYNKLGEAYAYAVNWVKENGYFISGAIRERYIDGCWNKSDSSEYLTEIQIPVK